MWAEQGTSSLFASLKATTQFPVQEDHQLLPLLLLMEPCPLAGFRQAKTSVLAAHDPSLPYSLSTVLSKRVEEASCPLLKKVGAKYQADIMYMSCFMAAPI